MAQSSAVYFSLRQSAAQVASCAIVLRMPLAVARRLRSVIAGLILVAACAPRAALAQAPEEWTRPFPPFRIIGNVYWVGSYDLASYLITTPQGHILINTGVGDTANQIKASIEQLGFALSDIRILTATHGHYDHTVGLAALKRMTGARLLVNAADPDLFETGGRTDFLWGDRAGMRFDAVKVDGTFTDGETIALGGTTLTAHHHPGHTKGATSFTMTVRDGGKDYRVIIANMGSINPGARVSGMPSYPGIREDYARTFMKQKDMAIDVWLASHASQFRLHEKYSPGAAYDPNRFVDPQGFRAAVQRLEQVYLEQLARERAERR